MLETAVTTALLGGGLTLFAYVPHLDSSSERTVPGGINGRIINRSLAVRLTVPPAGSVEDLNLQVGAPCRAHKTKGPKQSFGQLGFEP